LGVVVGVEDMFFRKEYRCLTVSLTLGKYKTYSKILRCLWKLSFGQIEAAQRQIAGALTVIINQQKGNIMNAYDFHSSIDFLIVQATEKILNAKSLEKSRHYFYSDFLNDSGIINLLRKEYLKNGNFGKLFSLYQGSRLEPKSHRYESLIAVLIITIVGKVVSEILLDVYRKNPDKIRKVFDEKILKSIKIISDKIQNKFIRGEKNSIKKDFKNLINCYIARLMLERQLIDLVTYYKLVDFHIYGNEIDAELTLRFNQFIEKYHLEKNAIIVDDLYSMIEAYSKGVFLKYLDEKKCNILYHDNIKTANKLHGLPASPGACKGKVMKGTDSVLVTKRISHKILCMDGGDWDREMHIKIFNACSAVVTWNTSMAGHLPLFCRRLNKPCVIINESEENLLIDNDDIVIDGGKGLIYTGLWVNN